MMQLDQLPMVNKLAAERARLCELLCASTFSLGVQVCGVWMDGDMVHILRPHVEAELVRRIAGIDAALEAIGVDSAPAAEAADA